MVTANEAKKILLEQRKRNQERQKKHVERMKAEGYRRIAVMLSGEAHQALENAAQKTGKTKGELVASAILETYAENDVNVPRGTNVSANVNVPRGTIDTDALIMQYRDEGLSYAAIADRLNSDGIPSARGGAWHKGTVANIVRRLRGK